MLEKKRNQINIIEVKSKRCDGIDEIQFVRKKKTLIQWLKSISNLIKT